MSAAPWFKNQPQKGEKNAIEDVYVGCLPESDPLCKCHETWHGGSCRVRNRSDRCWSTPVNRFLCVVTPKLSPCHRQGPSGLLQLFPLPRERVISFLLECFIRTLATVTTTETYNYSYPVFSFACFIQGSKWGNRGAGMAIKSIPFRPLYPPSPPLPPPPLPSPLPLARRR